MEYFPIHINLKNRKCLVIGGGRVALRKIEALMNAGALVTVISENISPELKKKIAQLEIIERKFRSRDIKKEYVLIIASTDNAEINRRIYNLCEESNILCNVVDKPELCNFIVPAILDRGKVLVSVSTSGASPYLAASIKDKMKEVVGDEYRLLADFLAEKRDYIKSILPTQEKRKEFWEKFFEADVGLIALNEGREGLVKRLDSISAIL